MSLEIKIDGMNKVRRKLGALEAQKIAEQTMADSVRDVREFVAVYAPASEANDPSRGRWYERGYGPRWRTRDGQIHGRKTSEMMGRRWAWRVEDRGMRGVVGNNASYVRYVQDEDKQAWFHKARGWRTAQLALRERALYVVTLWRRTIREILER